MPESAPINNRIMIAGVTDLILLLIPSMITFHPAYLLRQEHQKIYSWADLKEIKKKIIEFKLNF